MSICIIIYTLFLHFNDLIGLSFSDSSDYLYLYFTNYQSPEDMDIISYVLAASGYLIFPLMYGNHIYTDLSKQGIYSFTRQKSKKKWYTKKITELIVLAVIYLLVSLIVNSIIVCFVLKNPKILFEKYILLYWIKIHISEFGIIISLCLLQNIIAAKAGSSISLITTVSVFALELFNTKYILDSDKSRIPYIFFNPILNHMNIIFENTDFAYITANMLLPVFLLILCGRCLLKSDIGLNDKEV